MNTKNQMVLLSGIAIVALASIMFFYYMVTKEPLQNKSKETKVIGVFLGSAGSKSGLFCSIKLKNGKNTVIDCSSDSYYRIGQEIVLYKSTNSSGIETYRIENIFDSTVTKPNPSLKRDS